MDGCAFAHASVSGRYFTRVTARCSGMVPWSGYSHAKPDAAGTSRQLIIATRMEAKLSPGTGIVILIVVASCFASNHLSARIAFDHGASVAAAVAVRASSTAIFLLFLLKFLKVSFAVPAGVRGWALLAGVLIAV